MTAEWLPQALQALRQPANALAELPLRSATAPSPKGEGDSKAAQGLSVWLRLRGIFTPNSASLGRHRRQGDSDWTIRKDLN